MSQARLVNSLHFLIAGLLSLIGTVPCLSAPLLPPGDKAPILRVEAGGPTAFVTGLAFSPDGEALYAAGFDKVVRVWTRGPQGGPFVLDSASYRVPIGPGLGGAINALALSPDGLWLAAAGNGVFRGAARFGEVGQWLPSSEMSDDMLLDQGMIYVFNTRTGAVRLLRGHRGPVLSLAFAPQASGQAPRLLSAGRERSGKGTTFSGGVCLWDVAAATELARKTDLPDPRAERPGLALAAVGAGPKQLHIGLAWNDGKFRLWDVAADRLWEHEDGAHNLSVAFLPGPGVFVTGSRHRGTDQEPGYGLLTLWAVKAGQGPQAMARLKLPNVEKQLFFPWALAPCSSRGDGTLDRVAVALRVVEGKNQEDRLRIINPDPKQFHAEAESIPLWRSSGQTVLAAAPRSKYLAAAGNGTHDIGLFALADLLGGNGKPLTVLHSEGRIDRCASFVTRAGSLGLLLSPTLKTAPGAAPPGAVADDLVFDFAQRSLSADRSGWQADAPALAGWSVRLQAGADHPAPVLVVERGTQVIGNTVLKAGDHVTDYALLPPGPFEKPLLAVAALDVNHQPELILYNAASGERLRVLAGHQGIIRSVAFAASGRLLVSAAEDQTVCVWSLANLDQVLGNRGQLRGVTVEETPAGLSVRVDRTSPAWGKLEAGAILEGFVHGDKLQKLVNSRAFYDVLYGTKPDTPITLRLRDAQGKVRDVALTVDQGVDENKPLLSLFVTRRTDGRGPEWVAWSPVGPYDVSDRKAERLIGWHLNTGKPEEPAVFAGADQYRKQYYRPGLLRHLVARGNVATALGDWLAEARAKRPAPSLALLLDDPAPQKVKGGQLVQQPKAGLRLMVGCLEDYDDIDAAEWSLDGGPFHAFADGTGGTYRADLAPADWKRGPHTVRARLRLKDGLTYTQDLALHYQPAPAVVTLDGPERRTVDATEVAVEGSVRPAEAVKVRVLLRHGAKVETVAAWDTDRPREVAVKVPLAVGENVIEIEAVNKGAPAGQEEWETARRAILVTRQPAKAPEVRLEAVVEQSEAATRHTPQPGQVVIVPAKRVRVTGRIRAEGKLTAATWDRDGQPAQTLTNFTANAQAEFTIDEEITLEAGAQVLHFRAQAAGGGGAAASSLTIAYQPPVPAVVITAPEDGAAFVQGKDPATVPLRALLLPVSDKRPLQAVVFVNGCETADKPVIDAAGRLLTARVVLQPGDNRIEVRLSNEWTQGTPAEVHVRYRRPPRIVVLTPPAPGDRPLVDLAATVESPADLPLTAAEVWVEGAGQSSNRRPAAFVRQSAATGTVTWKVTATDVPLEAGPNTLRLVVSNADGPCLEPKVLPLEFKAKKATVARVEFLEPRQDAITVKDPEFRVRLRVQSESALRSVQLLRDDHLVFTAGPGAAVKNAAGNLELNEALPVELQPGANRLRLVAVNDGGEASASLTLSYVDQPVKLVIDGLERKSRPGEYLTPEVECNGRIEFTAAAPEARVWVHGRAVWLDRTDPRLEDCAAEVRLWVNGFRQAPARLEPRDGPALERKFRAEILLSRAEGNRVELELPDLKRKSGLHPQFTVNCLKPEDHQRLHLLIVAVGQKDGDQVKSQVLTALRARATSCDEFATPAFSAGKVYGPLVENVSRQRLFTQLCLMRLNIEALTRRAPSCDVIMVYYKGGESLALDPYLWSSVEEKKRQVALTQTALEQYFAGTPGAHVVLLDVARDKAAANNGRLPDDVRFGVFRLSWLDAAAAQSDRLIRELGDAMAQGSKLGDVAAALGREMSQLEQRNKELTYDHYLPKVLEGLVVSRAKK